MLVRVSAGLSSAAPYSRLRFFRLARLCSAATVTSPSGGRSPISHFLVSAVVSRQQGCGGSPPVTEERRKNRRPLPGLSCGSYFRHVINIRCRLSSPIRSATAPSSLLIYSFSLAFLPMRQAFRPQQPNQNRIFASAASSG